MSATGEFVAMVEVMESEALGEGLRAIEGGGDGVGDRAVIDEEGGCCCLDNVGLWSAELGLGRTTST